MTPGDSKIVLPSLANDPQLLFSMVGTLNLPRGQKLRCCLLGYEGRQCRRQGGSAYQVGD